MGRLMHALAMQLYRFLISLAAAGGHAKAKGWIAMRTGSIERIAKATGQLQPGQSWMWFHCASVGEFEQARPVMEAWRALHPEDAFLLTFYSPSGWNAFASRKPQWWCSGDHVEALPLDRKADVKRFLNAAGGSERIRGMLLAKYDVWPNLISELATSGVPTGLFAGHVLPGRWPFRLGGGYQREAWDALDRIWVQGEDSVEVLSSFGIQSEAVGDPRFDRVVQAADFCSHDAALEAWINERPCAVIGSAWNAEVDAAFAAWDPGQCILVVPHEWNDASVLAMAERWRDRGAAPVIWSEHRGKDRRAAFPSGDVLIVDAMGELLALYAVAQVAVVGGGFGQGVHNTLEPAAHGVPVLVGPKVERFAEVEALRQAGALAVCLTPTELSASLSAALEDAAACQQKGEAARAFARRQAGAGRRIAAAWDEVVGASQGS